MNRCLCALAALCLALTACARQPDMTLAWQAALPHSGAQAAVRGCAVTETTSLYWNDTAAPAEEIVLLTATEQAPYLQLSGAEASEVTVAFATRYDTGYRLYSEADPGAKVDYVFTAQADGTLQYRLDTIYSFVVTVATEQGTDRFLVDCQRSE